MSSTPDAYQGWRNRETWTIALCIGADRDEAQRWADTIAELHADPDLGGIGRQFALADRLRAWYDDIEGHEVIQRDAPIVFWDLLQVALDRINWDEIAEHLLKND